MAWIASFTRWGCTAAVIASAASWAPNQASAAPILPSLEINTVSQSEGNSGTTQFVFTISLDSAAPLGGVTFDIATADRDAVAGFDYVGRSLTGQMIAEGLTSYTFVVDVLGDLLVESVGPSPGERYEAFDVYVTNLLNAGGIDTVGTGFILDDDEVQRVPEPTSLVLALGSLAALAGVRGRASQRRR